MRARTLVWAAALLLTGEDALVAQTLPPSTPRTPETTFTAMAGGDGRHWGRSPFRAPHNTPTLAWRVRTRHRIFAAVGALSTGGAVFGSLDGSVHAVDAAGVVRWSHLGASRVFAAPATVGDLVVVGEDGGAFVGLRNGREVWRIPTPEDADAPPVVGDDGTVYLASREAMAVRASGDIVWRTALVGHAFGAPALTDAALYVPEMNGAVALFDRTRGTLLRRVALGARTVAGVLVTEDGGFVIGCEDGHIRAFTAEGTARWDYATTGAARGLGVRGMPALRGDGTVFVGAEDGALYGLRVADGTLAFRVQTFGPVRSTPTLDRDGWAVFGSEDDRVYALTPTGAIAWFVTVGADVDSSPRILADGVVVAGADDGALYGLRGE